MAFPAMLPDVSTTNVMSLGAASSRPAETFGAALRKKVPSWPPGRKASREKPKRPASGVMNRRKSLSGKCVPVRVTHRGPPGGGARDRNRMGRTMDGSQPGRGMDVHDDADLGDGPGREFFRAQGIEVGDAAVVFFQYFVVGNLDPFAAAGLDGEDAHAEYAAPVIFQQGGVAQPAHDVLVDAPGLGGVEQLGPGLAAVDPHAEIIDDGAGGQREQVVAFQAGGVGVVELLVDGRAWPSARRSPRARRGARPPAGRARPAPAGAGGG